MIQLEHISKKFKKKAVLNDISYTFEAGKIYGIYGINGSGKTMLLRIISGLVFPTSGSIIINGKTLHKEISFPDHMGLIIENMELQPQLTAFENLEELNKINHYATTSDMQDALEYSCAITPQVRQAGNRLSGLTETAYASLLA